MTDRLLRDAIILASGAFVVLALLISLASILTEGLPVLLLALVAIWIGIASLFSP